MIRTYRELKTLPTYEARYDYLKLVGAVGETTFGYDRYLNQIIYKTRRWRSARDIVIARDNGCDLGIAGYEIHDKIIVHHMNILTLDQIENEDDCIFEPELLISTNMRTHNAIHFGRPNVRPYNELIERTRNDTCPWKL